VEQEVKNVQDHPSSPGSFQKWAILTLEIVRVNIPRVADIEISQKTIR
jgi:hypothetical protein